MNSSHPTRTNPTQMRVIKARNSQMMMNQRLILKKAKKPLIKTCLIRTKMKKSRFRKLKVKKLIENFSPLIRSQLPPISRSWSPISMRTTDIG